jgi:hypothetical protein
MKDQAFRFRVATADGECSQDWLVWNKKNDVYAGARNTSHEYKASFHSSGECHVALSQDIRKSLISDPDWSGRSRVFGAWSRDPAECHKGPQHLLQIVFSSAYLDVLAQKHEGNVRVIESRPGTISSVGIYRARLPSDAVVQSDDPTLTELTRMLLPNGDSVLLISHELPETEEYLTFLRTRLLSHLEAQRSPAGRTYGKKPTEMPGAGVRALLWDGARHEKYWHEASARKMLSMHFADK